MNSTRASVFDRPSSDSSPIVDGNFGANFTGIVDTRELFISDVVHEALVSVNEEGTEAAAAAAVVIRRAVSGGELTSLTLDRPFIFMIQNDATGAILFIGQVTDPSS